MRRSRGLVEHTYAGRRRHLLAELMARVAQYRVTTHARLEAESDPSMCRLMIVDDEEESEVVPEISESDIDFEEDF